MSAQIRGHLAHRVAKARDPGRIGGGIRAGCTARRRTVRRGTRIARHAVLDAASWRGEVDRFDWMSQWYPMGFAKDFGDGRMEKVTLFDTDYVVVLAKRRGSGEDGGTTVSCLRDRCPHRLAALSEGRVTVQGFVQCAYHGWSFDGRDGACVHIPQAAAGNGKDGGPGSARTCAEAFPAAISQGMVWICPSSNPAQPDPPRVPEREPSSAFNAGNDFVRDFPIDYSFMVENICDPDHGLFAHQAQAFDLYSASKQSPQKVTRLLVTEPPPSSTGQQSKVPSPLLELRSEVDAVKKLTASGSDEDGSKSATALTGTTAFRPPCHVSIGRRRSDGDTNFVISFWVVPTGLGRCRFITTNLAKFPMIVPSWIGAITLNRFLDQDSFLVATEQDNCLEMELDAHRKGQKIPRRKMYCYQSPAEKYLVELGEFLDATLPKMPNRYSPSTIAQYMSRARQPRESVLDRWSQHTAISRDSRRAVRNCAVLSYFALAWATVSLCRMLGRPAPWTAVQLCAAAVVFALARKVISEFKFKKTEAQRDNDLRKIDDVYPDSRITLHPSPLP